MRGPRPSVPCLTKHFTRIRGWRQEHKYISFPRMFGCCSKIFCRCFFPLAVILPFRTISTSNYSSLDRTNIVFLILRALLHFYVANTGYVQYSTYETAQNCCIHPKVPPKKAHCLPCLIHPNTRFSSWQPATTATPLHPIYANGGETKSSSSSNSFCSLASMFLFPRMLGNTSFFSPFVLIEVTGTETDTKIASSSPFDLLSIQQSIHSFLSFLSSPPVALKVRRRKCQKPCVSSLPCSETPWGIGIVRGAEEGKVSLNCSLFRFWLYEVVYRNVIFCNNLICWHYSHKICARIIVKIFFKFSIMYETVLIKTFPWARLFPSVSDVSTVILYWGRGRMRSELSFFPGG